MKFTISGADRKTGEDITITLEAANPQEAMAKAASRHMLVAECVPASKAVAAPKPSKVEDSAAVKTVWWVIGTIGGLAAAVSVLGSLFGDTHPTPSKPAFVATPIIPTPPPLPPVHVVDEWSGKPDTTVTFTNWHLDGVYLVGTMVWHSEAITDVLYTIRENSVVRDRGSVIVPEFRRGEPQLAKVHLGVDVDLRPLDVTIEIKH
jgi:hypothetical protein